MVEYICKVTSSVCVNFYPTLRCTRLCQCVCQKNHLSDDNKIYCQFFLIANFCIVESNESQKLKMEVGSNPTTTLCAKARYNFNLKKQLLGCRIENSFQQQCATYLAWRWIPCINHISQKLSFRLYVRPLKFSTVCSAWVIVIAI